MQKFTLHCHTHALDCFDGRNTAEEMISQAEKMGFEAIGISNHFCYHPNMILCSPMFFNDESKVLDAHLRIIDEVRSAAVGHKIKVYVGAEVDFFPSAIWRNAFERLMKKLDFDYLIGSNHYIRTADESQIYNIYHLDCLPPNLSAEDFKELVQQHWNNVVYTVESGYFNFLAHPDYCVVKIPDVPEFEENRWKIIEALDKTKMPFEVNTSGYNRIDMQHPCDWMLQELCERKVPTLLSDDAHSTAMIGQHFERAENLLKKFGCKERLGLEFLQK